jgi:hypothetical protein
MPCFDFGLFAVLFFPVSLLWYCCWSRGWSGLLLLLLIFALWLVPWVLAVLTWIVFQFL